MKKISFVLSPLFSFTLISLSASLSTTSFAAPMMSVELMSSSAAAGNFSSSSSSNSVSISAAQAKKNLQATRAYYQSLIAPHSKRGAELTMLMTMLPKGGDIHHHYTGALYAEVYLDWVATQGYCVYRENNATAKQEKFRIEVKAINDPELAKNCWKPETIRKDNLFYRELLMTWSDLDFDTHTHQQLPPDQQFFNTFGYFGAVSKFNTNAGLRSLKERAQAENQQYLETMLKSAPITENAEFSARLDAITAKNSLATPSAKALDVSELHAIFAAYSSFLAKDKAAQDAIAAYVEEVNQDTKDIDSADFDLRVQTYVSRNSTPGKTFAGLYAAFAASERNPKIVGINIVGPEHGLIALRDYQLHMHMFGYLKTLFPKARLAMHAGELNLGLVAPEYLQSHIRDALEIAGAERIGHGVDIAYEKDAVQLLAALKQRKAAIEINLTSNSFILGVKEANHPVTLYLRHGIPVVISSDDMGVSRNNLSNEYILFASRYQPNYDQLKSIVYNSIRYSFMSDADKQKHLRLLDQKFLQFEAKVAGLK